MTDKIFLDTNLWVYLYDKKPPEKSQRVRAIVETQLSLIRISTQVLGELFHVLTRKKFVPKAEAIQIIQELADELPVIPIEAGTVLEALRIYDRYTFSYWDSLIIATALLNDCTTLYSEDMQHNQLIEGKTLIVNPFR